jgi:hypothetical protein
MPKQNNPRKKDTALTKEAIQDGVQPNPPRGERGGFLNVTVTLPPELYKLLAEEAARRKISKQANPIISGIIREAVQAYLSGPPVNQPK